MEKNAQIMESCKTRVFEILFAAFPESVEINDDVIFSEDLFAITFMRIKHDLSNTFYVEINHNTGNRLFLKYSPPEDNDLLTKNLLRSAESFCHDITSKFIGFRQEPRGDLKFITKEKAGVAARWWSSLLRTGRALPFFNPDLQTSDRISRFEDILTERLGFIFQKPHGVTISVDYSPCRILKQCWEKSDPEDQTDVIGVFPFKTSMTIYEDRIIMNGECV